MLSDVSYHAGKVVWVTTNSDLPAPARIADPDEDDNNDEVNKFCVYMFEFKKKQWVSKECVEPFEKNDVNLGVIPKSSYRNALLAAINYSQGYSEDSNDFSSTSEGNTRDQSDGGGKKTKVFYVNSGTINRPQPSVVRTTDAYVKLNRLPPEIHNAQSIYVSQSISSQNRSLVTHVIKIIYPTSNVGIIGCGSLGTEIAKVLLSNKFSVNVYNKTATKCEPLVEYGATQYSSPVELFLASNVVIFCVSNASVVKQIFYGANGIYPHVTQGKSLVVFTYMDCESSLDIEESVRRQHGRYIEAPVFRQSLDMRLSDPKNLVVLVAGDRSLFNDINYLLSFISDNVIWLGDVGNATKFSLILNSVMASMLINISEVLSLTRGMDISNLEIWLQDILSILSSIEFSPQIYTTAALTLLPGNIPLDNDAMKLQNLQEVTQNCLQLANNNFCSMPIAAATNEVLVWGRSRDPSPVYALSYLCSKLFEQQPSKET